MAKIKICGLRREQDIDAVNRYLPEYIGFVFAESRRKIGVEFAAELRKRLDCRIKAVGVFVNESVGNVLEAVSKCGLNAVQLHGDEQPEFLRLLRSGLDALKFDGGVTGRDSKSRVEIWKAARVKDRQSIERLREYEADAFVLDAYSDKSYGGAGVAFDWEMAAGASGYGKIILAGGLNAFNAARAIRTVRPYAVDVSSGVETGGFKDESKIRDFICISRSYEV